MNEKDVERNISLYKWFIMLREGLFWGPILILSIQSLGKMSLPEIYVMEAIVVGGLVILEIPSGALADLIGRKKSILFGFLLNLLSVIGFAIMSSPAHVWIANILWMFGLSLCSGADSAFLYDSLKSAGREGEYKKIEGNAIGNRFLLISFGCLTTGFLSKFGLRLPLLLNIAGVFVAFILIFFFKELNHKKENYSLKKQADLMKLSVLFVANHKPIKWIILFTVVIGAVSKIWFFTYNPYFQLVKLDISFYGVIFALLNIVAWVFSKHAYRIEEKIGEKWCVMSLILLTAVPILLMGTFVCKPILAVILFQNCVRGFMGPFVNGFMNKYLDSKNRATVISIRSAASGFVSFLGLNISGLVLKVCFLPSFLFILGITTLALGVIIYRQYVKISKNKRESS